MDHRVGDEILAPWHGDGFLYPGIVVGLADDQADVAFLDGGRARVSISSLRRAGFGPGLAVQARWRGQELFYGGVVTRRMGPAVHVAFDDGDADWITIGQCRVRAAVIDHLPADERSCTFCGTAMPADAPRCAGCGAPRGSG